MPKFSDIKRITRANYAVDIGWEYIRTWITEQDGVQVNLDPPYQRGYIWTEQQKIDYIEYILKDGTSGKDIYWNCPDWMRGFEGPLELVDGKQRLSAVLDFLDDKIKVFGHYYSEYDSKLDFLVARFRVHVHDLKDPEDIVQWYLDMNTGGSVHTEKDLEPAYKYLQGIREGKDVQKKN